MRMNRFALALSLLAIFVIARGLHPLRAETAAISEKDKIETLIKIVAEGKDLKFLRNGKAHDPATAASFLRRKWEANKATVKTAEDFIANVGSFSGTSGEPYWLRLKDGQKIKSRDFLLAELVRIEKSSISRTSKGNLSSLANPKAP